VNNSYTNIILKSTPHGYDLVEWSCINKEEKAFNKKLGTFTKSYKHITVIRTNFNRELFIRHGLHMNNQGKEMIAVPMYQ